MDGIEFPGHRRLFLATVTALPWLTMSAQFLHDVTSADIRKPDLITAKQIRNVWVHPKPGSEPLAFDRLSLDVIEHTSTHLERWMSEMEKALGLERYPNSEQLGEQLASALGTKIRSASSDPSKREK